MEHTKIIYTFETYQPVHSKRNPTSVATLWSCSNGRLTGDKNEVSSGLDSQEVAGEAGGAMG